MVTAFDGRDGIDKALRVDPVVIVSDIMMPHESGVEMVAQMRTRPALQRVPILLLSAKADEELMVRLLEHGAQDFIVKPFSERDLLPGNVRRPWPAPRPRRAGIIRAALSSVDWLSAKATPAFAPKEQRTQPRRPARGASRQVA